MRRAAIEARGAVVGEDGMIAPRPGERRCPFQSDAGLCGLHETPDKPFGCIASPFTLNAGDTLIVRNRYRMLKCFNDGDRIPAYVAFRASLDLILGKDEAARVCGLLDGGATGMIDATVPAESYRKLKDNDDAKHGRTPAIPADRPGQITPTWLTGDSADIVPRLGKTDDDRFDMVFSCPPYFDLEVYSDDPADLSVMPAGDFIDVYRRIIAASCAALRDNRFAAFVVSNVRNPAGTYRDLVGLTVRAFEDAGLSFYNEAVIVNPVGSLPIRVGRQFTAGRKLGRTHQLMLMFVKGDPTAAVAALGEIDLSPIEAIEQEIQKESPAAGPGDDDRDDRDDRDDQSS